MHARKDPFLTSHLPLFPPCGLAPQRPECTGWPDQCASNVSKHSILTAFEYINGRMQMRLRSFMSEKTAEYVLGPDLVRHLDDPSLTIFSFASTREGNIRHIAGEPVEADLVSAFARRPKISWRNHPEIPIMKVNPVLAEYSQASVEAGIPVLAGMPMVTRLQDMNNNVRCSWIDLRTIGSLDEPLLLQFHTGTCPNGVEYHEPMKGEALRSTMRGNWKPLEELFETLKQLRPILKLTQFGGYKPFHILRTRTPNCTDPIAPFK